MGIVCWTIQQLLSLTDMWMSVVIAEEASVPRKVPVVGAARDGLAVAAAVTHFGKLDILLNNVGASEVCLVPMRKLRVSYGIP